MDPYQIRLNLRYTDYFPNMCTYLHIFLTFPSNIIYFEYFLLFLLFSNFFSFMDRSLPSSRFSYFKTRIGRGSLGDSPPNPLIRRYLYLIFFLSLKSSFTTIFLRVLFPRSSENDTKMVVHSSSRRVMPQYQPPQAFIRRAACNLS